MSDKNSPYACIGYSGRVSLGVFMGEWLLATEDNKINTYVKLE